MQTELDITLIELRISSLLHMPFSSIRVQQPISGYRYQFTLRKYYKKGQQLMQSYWDNHTQNWG